jgi:hypothetical protein
LTGHLQIDADPDPVPDPANHFDADPDTDPNTYLMRIFLCGSGFLLNADSDPYYQNDADPNADLDPQHWCIESEVGFKDTGAGSNVLLQPNPVQDPDPGSQINGEIRIPIRIRLLKFLSSYSGLRIQILKMLSTGWHIYSFLVDSFAFVPYPFPDQVHTKGQINRY